jgi:hypothetical protein
VPTNDPTVRRSAVVSIEHFAQKAARLRDLRAKLGRTGPFDMAVAPAFRPRQPDRASADQFLDEVHQLADLGVNWIWTSFPGVGTAGYTDLVAWFGQEVIARFHKERAAPPAGAPL